ncbi:MAG: hypothetical protein CVT90_01600 [Candidatus Altiarchaeales archaeon HGW-Altiarchaeales-3]|nr:MAG: hypothetical protein CVT90_01600 [Candidatus Altiarchaeales archaeon HGW-Altiarchaeales-3]
MFPRRRRDIFDIFGDDMFRDMFRDVEEEFARMDEMFKRSISESMRKKSGEGAPFIYGFSLRTGPDGKPIINEFGNVGVGASKRKGSELQFTENEREPMVDVIEGDSDVTVIAELPGIEKEDIKLNVTENEMEILVDTKKRKYHKELNLPCEIKPDSAKASYKNGVLEIKLKRLQNKAKKRGVKVNVE